MKWKINTNRLQTSSDCVKSWRANAHFTNLFTTVFTFLLDTHDISNPRPCKLPVLHLSLASFFLLSLFQNDIWPFPCNQRHIRRWILIHSTWQHQKSVLTFKLQQWWNTQAISHTQLCLILYITIPSNLIQMKVCSVVSMQWCLQHNLGYIAPLRL